MSLNRLKDRSGSALVVAILLTLLISAMAVGMVVLTVTEKSISHHQRVGKQALYNADAGIEAAKQQMTLFSQSKMDSLRAVWPGVGAIITDPLNFFPTGGFSFESEDLGLEVGTSFEFVDSTLHSTSQTFNFQYTSVATGSASIDGQSDVISQGNLRLSASRGSFTDYLVFTDVHYTPSGSKIWFHTTGYFDGRVHSNGKLRFAYFPTFEDLVTSVPQKAVYYNYGSSIELDADRNGSRDVPNFYGGFERGVDPIHLPENSFSQERAALGYAAADTTPLSTSQIKQALGFDPADPNPIPEGLYVPNEDGAVTGGVYIIGDASAMSMWIDSDGYQNYEITDQNGVTKRIVLDRTNTQTKVYAAAGDSTIYAGLPRGMIYVTGGISSLGGLPRIEGTPPPAIEEETQLTITAVDDILISNDIIYRNYGGAQSVLGVYSSNGDIGITTSAPNELMIDAFVFAAGDKGAFTVDSYNRGSYRGQVHLRGGVVQRYYGPFGTFSQSGASTGYGRDFRYDRRGIDPPYYPLTYIFKVDRPVPHVTSWREL